MRRGLLRIAEIFGWTATAFSLFLAGRMFLIFLSVLNPAFCDISCDIGQYLVPVSLCCFVVGWAPAVTLVFIHRARRSLTLVWVPHSIVITATFTVAMLYVAGVSYSFPDVDGRSVVLAVGGAAFLLLTEAFLVGAVLLDRKLPETEPEVHFFQEDVGD
jgi:hypothetical protein